MGMILSYLTAAAMSTAAGIPAQAAGSTSQGDPPSRVSLGIYLVDLWGIEGARQSFKADFVVYASWQDPRLSHGGPGRRPVDLDRVWHPRVQVVNARTLSPLGFRRCDVSPEGIVTYVERFSGELSARLDVADFPFDRQRVAVVVTCGPTDQPLEVGIRADRTGRSRTLSIADWDAGPGSFRPSEYLFAGTGESLPGMAYEIEVRRNAGFYLLKVFLPLLFIVCMASAVFWMDPAKLATSQVNVSVTSMLTLTAYRFSLGDDVPKVGTFTRFDAFFTAATVFVFLALIVVIVTTSAAARGKEALARRIVAWARWAFPAALLLGVGALLAAG